MKVALITNSHLSPRELVTSILDELEVEYVPGSKHRLIQQLNAFLIRQLASDTNVVLIIDEAQNLSPRVLEEVRMLSNLETEKEKLIQLILVGQPQLKAKLERDDLLQFKQRIAVYFHLSALTKDETVHYVNHRLRLVSPVDPGEIFTPGALELVYHYSRGIPRVINLLCDSSLLSGYVFNTRVIDDKIVRDVIREREFHSSGEVQHHDDHAENQTPGTDMADFIPPGSA